jgi:tRNA (guanine-N7-)-methyltransferase
VARAQRKRMRAQLANLWFCCAEANEFLDSLPTRVLFSRVFMLFPDPWPKKRHQKHRLLAEPFLSRLASKVQDRADLFFRTDCADYFEWSLTAVREHPGWRLDPDHTWPFECETVFQARAAAVHSLVAIRA